MDVSSAQNLKTYFDICAASPDNHGVLGLPEKPDDVANLKYYTNQEIHSYALAAAQFYLDQGLEIASSPSGLIGISARGLIEWLATFIALSRLGYGILVLSPTLSDDVLSKLLERAECHMLVTDKDQEQLRSMNTIKTFPFIPRKALTEPVSFSDLTEKLAPIPPSSTAFIWHSSGSTGIPKLLPLNQASAMARTASFVNSPYKVTTIWLHSSFYNSGGLTFMLGTLAKPCWTAWYNDLVPFSGRGLLQFLRECRPQTLLNTPWSLETIVNEPGGMELLQLTSSVVVFGAVLPQELGDSLIRQGVRLVIGYALSETSNLLTSARRMQEDPTDKDWDYLNPLPGLKEHMWFKPLSTSMNQGTKEELYELVILKGSRTIAFRSNSDDPPGSFHTGDVFVKHPTKEDCWKVIGRKDDQLNMAMPVVINANDYETVVGGACRGDTVEEVILFGQGRQKLGVLVFVKAEADEETAKDAVWKELEKLNPKMKIRVEREMIVVVKGQQVPRTDKGNFMRAAVYKRFGQAIDVAYGKELHVNGSS